MLQAHAGRLKPEDLGVVGNNQDLGFFIPASGSLYVIEAKEINPPAGRSPWLGQLG